MTDYIDRSLAPDEAILVRGRWPLVFWLGAWAALLLLGVLIVGFFIFARAAIMMSTARFAVTDQRVILRRGWLNRNTQELAVESVEGVHLNQNVWERLWNYGQILASGAGDARIAFPPMADPVRFRRAIETARARAGRVEFVEVGAPAEQSAERARRAHSTNTEHANDHDLPPLRRQPRRFVGLRRR